MMAERQFADIWARTVLSVRERRLLLLGLLVGQGHDGELYALSLQGPLYRIVPA
jgi:4-carboxymuconolactone decarboxylase